MKHVKYSLHQQLYRHLLLAEWRIPSLSLIHRLLLALLVSIHQITQVNHLNIFLLVGYNGQSHGQSTHRLCSDYTASVNHVTWSPDGTLFVCYKAAHESFHVRFESLLYKVFKYYSDNVTDDSLLRMLKVIKKDLKLARQQETYSDDDDDDDDDTDDADLLDIEEAKDFDEVEIGDNTSDGDEQSKDSKGTVVKESHEENSDDDSNDSMDD
nr:myb-binding protein 1A-like protein [Tanacetum cinerariifolium]